MHRHAADISKQEIYSGTCGCRENPTYFVLIQRPLGIHAFAYMNRSEQRETRFQKRKLEGDYDRPGSPGSIGGAEYERKALRGPVFALCNLYVSVRNSISLDNRY